MISFLIIDFVHPIPLALFEPAVKQPVTAVGWGLTNDDPYATISDKLFKVTTPVEHDQVAADFYGDFIDWDTKICTDSSGGMGTCNVSCYFLKAQHRTPLKKKKSLNTLIGELFITGF